MAEASAMGTCPRCAAPIAIQPGAGVPRCPFCGAVSVESIEVERAVLGNLGNRFQRKQIREELLRRKEVLETNLGTIDPLARWTGGEPVWLSRTSVGAACGAFLIGLSLVGAGDAGVAPGVLMVIGTALYVVARTVSYMGSSRRYSAARTVSASNRQIIQNLRADLRETMDLLGQLDSQGETR